MGTGVGEGQQLQRGLLPGMLEIRRAYENMHGQDNVEGQHNGFLSGRWGTESYRETRANKSNNVYETQI